MTILTDDLIEKGARGIVNCADLTCHCWRHHFDDARAALQSVLPDVVEKCAQEADAYSGEKPQKFRILGASIIARNIRSLLNKEDNANG